MQEMRDWRIKHGQGVPQKTVRNMSTKDNPGTLPINLYVTEQPTSQPFDFGTIGEVQGETVATARERGGEDFGTIGEVQGETVVTARERGGGRRGQVILTSRLVILSILPQMLHLEK